MTVSVLVLQLSRIDLSLPEPEGEAQPPQCAPTSLSWWRRRLRCGRGHDGAAIAERQPSASERIGYAWLQRAQRTTMNQQLEMELLQTNPDQGQGDNRVLNTTWPSYTY